MSSVRPDPTSSDEVQKFLADRRPAPVKPLKKMSSKWQLMRRVAEQVRLLNALHKLCAALKRTEGSRKSSAELAEVADALLDFAKECHRCLQHKADTRLNAVGQAESNGASEGYARGLYASAVAGDRTALLAKILAVNRCSHDTQVEVWALVDWLADKIARPHVQKEVAAPQTPTAQLPDGESIATSNCDGEQDTSTMLPLEQVSKSSPLGMQTAALAPRLSLNKETRTITIDNKSFPNIDQTAFRIFEAIYDAHPTPISSSTFKTLESIKAKNYTRELNKLRRHRLDKSRTLRSLVKGTSGAGYRIELPATCR
jgi:hypothetical protein